eukprot:1231836-Ditylum_brightwellii.AAC.1
MYDLEIIWADDIILENVHFQGHTPVTQSATTDSSWKLCPSWKTISAIRLPSRLIRSWHGKYGITQINTTFSDFDFTKDSGCGVDYYSYQDWSRGDLHFDYTTTLSGMGELSSINDYFCKANTVGVDDVIMFDENGSLSPTESAGFSTIVTNNVKMTSYSECTTVPDHCYAYCPDQCLRTMTYLVEHNISDQMQLYLTDEDGKSITVANKVENKEHKWEWMHRKYSVSLPPNKQYTAEFIDQNNERTWP